MKAYHSLFKLKFALATIDFLLINFIILTSIQYVGNGHEIY